MASRPPTPGVLSRGIGLEGLSSVLAGLWGTGTGSTTLTENIHTIAVTKMGSRRAVELGACVLIVLSLIGKYLSVSSFYLLAILTTLITCQLTNSSKKKRKDVGEGGGGGSNKKIFNHKRKDNTRFHI